MKKLVVGLLIGSITLLASLTQASAGGLAISDAVKTDLLEKGVFANNLATYENTGVANRRLQNYLNDYGQLKVLVQPADSSYVVSIDGQPYGRRKNTFIVEGGTRHVTATADIGSCAADVDISPGENNETNCLLH